MYGRVHGRQRPRTLAINTAMFGLSMDHVHSPCTAVYTVRTRPWKAVYTGRKHGRVQGTRTAVLYSDGRVHGRLPCTCYGPYTRPCSSYKRTMYKAHARPCTRSVHDPGRPCAQIVNTRRVDCRVHGRPCTPHTALFTAVSGPCTRRLLTQCSVDVGIDY